MPDTPPPPSEAPGAGDVLVRRVIESWRELSDEPTGNPAFKVELIARLNELERGWRPVPATGQAEEEENRKWRRAAAETIVALATQAGELRATLREVSPERADELDAKHRAVAAAPPASSAPTPGEFDPATDPVVRAVIGDGPGDFTGLDGIIPVSDEPSRGRGAEDEPQCSDTSENGQSNAAYLRVIDAVRTAAQRGLPLHDDDYEEIADAAMNAAEVDRKIECPICPQWSWHGPAAEAELFQHFEVAHAPSPPAAPELAEPTEATIEKLAKWTYGYYGTGRIEWSKLVGDDRLYWLRQARSLARIVLGGDGG